MRSFEFVVDFRDKYAGLAAKNPRICGAYTAIMKHYRDRLTIIGTSCSSEQKEILEMMVRECSMLRDIAVETAVSKKLSKE